MPATNRPKLALAGPGPPGRKTHGRYAVFLDRDGVIIHDNPAHICRLEQVQLLDGAAEAILRLNDAGCLVGPKPTAYGRATLIGSADPA